MRLCRVQVDDRPRAAFYDDESIVLVEDAIGAMRSAGNDAPAWDAGDDLISCLPPDGHWFQPTLRVFDWLQSSAGGASSVPRHSTNSVQLLVPVPRPPKLFLLAGNYADHIREGGGIAAERAETFPYVFMKPPSTTLTDPGRPIRIPSVSPDHIDWELELAVVIGRRVKGVCERDALNCVAGYTIVNDISNRKFRPNPNRKPREKDTFFDWLHGKWHDSFCVCGPCIASADSIPDPQSLAMQLRVNDRLHQDASTGLQIFPVAAVIEFISSFVTLEPGDIISTGTPAGVGNTTGTYLRSGDQMAASIERIGVLTTPVVDE